jgi:hypothetical protein
MAKYLVETYYTCSFKVDPFLDDINETEFSILENRNDGKFEILDVKFDTRKTKILDAKNKNLETKKLDIVKEPEQLKVDSKVSNQNFVKKFYEAAGKSFCMPARRKGYIP